ncbi:MULTISPECIES: aminodeoxychorismate lyase [Bacillus]|uniref:4-amino-4-deoxychorismate lyase n=2 Tax=Bacillus TaxID=1386 RepID=A0A0M4GBW5_9BACI|nr:MULTISPECIES: aminodeoxychorismate lyase [Bacillus]ALC83295.1 4-amino-4-deoxychorismate lyase [Bacillus gobiensis]MBP1084147.1 4-amino-4-deoxychorismate lyase [Bacillus capparidis]MED1098151.1 aminodeoxychorismate lyase [Bacillus capparidis]
MIIYLNGQYVEEKEAMLSPLDHGFLYGVGVFESFCLIGAKPFLLEWHLERLHYALNDLGINIHLEKREVLHILAELLKRNRLQGGNARIRLNVSAGPGEKAAPSANPYLNPSVLILISPFQPDSIPEEKNGILLNLRRNTPEGHVRLKSHHFLNNIYAKKEVGNDSSKEGIFLTSDHYVAEGITSNIFWRKDQTVFTPSIGTGILNGVMRRYVLQVLKENGYEIRVGKFRKESLLEADEAWLTNSVQAIVPFAAIESSVYPGKNGMLTIFLKQVYNKERQA